MRHPPTTKHNYLDKVLKLRNELSCGIHDAEVRHDKWCDIYKQGFCNCNPLVSVKPLIIGKH